MLLTTRVEITMTRCLWISKLIYRSLDTSKTSFFFFIEHNRRVFHYSHFVYIYRASTDPVNLFVRQMCNRTAILIGSARISCFHDSERLRHPRALLTGRWVRNLILALIHIRSGIAEAQIRSEFVPRRSTEPSGDGIKAAGPSLQLQYPCGCVCLDGQLSLESAPHAGCASCQSNWQGCALLLIRDRHNWSAKSMIRAASLNTEHSSRRNGWRLPLVGS